MLMDELLGAKLRSPDYVAEMLCVPPVRPVRLMLAVLPVKAIFLGWPPSTEKATVPVGVPAFVDVTVAVMVTVWPKEAFPEAGEVWASVVLVVAWLRPTPVSVRLGDEVLRALLEKDSCSL